MTTTTMTMTNYIFSIKYDSGGVVCLTFKLIDNKEEADRAEKIIEYRDNFCEHLSYCVEEVTLLAVSSEVIDILQQLAEDNVWPDFPIDEYNSFIPPGEDEPLNLDDFEA